MSVEELMKKASGEQIKRIQNCRTREEILAAAKEEDFALTEAEAEEILQVLYPPYGEISDDALDMVAGGKGDDEPECDHKGAATLLKVQNGVYTYRCGRCGETFEERRRR